MNSENPSLYKRDAAPKEVTDSDLLSIISVEKRLGYYSDSTIDKWALVAKKVHYKTHEFFVSPQNPTSELAYVAKGLFRAYALSVDGSEATLFIAFENTLVGPYYNEPLGESSIPYIQAMEDSVLYVVTRDEYMPLLEEDECLRKAFELDAELDSAIDRVRIISLMTKDALERWREQRDLWKENGVDIGRIKDKYIASYLGICPETFNRIKNKAP